MFLYTPKSGSKIVASSQAIPILTLRNGSHHICSGFDFVVGDGSRYQRTTFGRIAEALCALSQSVAFDERGTLGLVSRRPFEARRIAEMAGLYVDRESLAWRLLGAGLARVETCEPAPWALPLGGGLCAVEVSPPPAPTELERPIWIAGKGWRWTYGEARWTTGEESEFELDFQIDPAPAIVAGVAVAGRDWTELARCCLFREKEQLEELTPAEKCARDLARDWRSTDSERDWLCHVEGTWAARLDAGKLSVRGEGDTSGEASVWASSAEERARKLLTSGIITSGEAEILTGCDVHNDSVGLSGARAELSTHASLEIADDGFLRVRPPRPVWKVTESA